MFAQRSSVRHLVAAAALLGAAVLANGRAEADEFLRGYLQGVLVSRFPGLELTVRSLGPEHIVVAAGTCLGASQKREVERALAQSGQALTVTWDPVADCKRAPAPAEGVEFHALPERELFAPLLADPRQPRFSMSYQRYDTPADTFNAAAVALGEYFGLASGFLGESGASQFGIQAGVFALFNLDAPSEDLINADYWIGFPLSYRRGPWSYVLRLYHQSSHLGDEFTLGNPGFDRINLSYEGLDVLFSHEWRLLRVYGGGGYILNSEPDLAPWSAHAGVEYVRPRTAGKLDLVVATDVRFSQELDWSRSRSVQAGFELRGVSQRSARLMFEYFRGHSPNGQFYRDKLRYLGLGLYFGF
jgi:hypothetical protein